MVTYTINLDLIKENYTILKCKQNDDITLKFQIFNNSITEDITGATVILNALKADNTFVKQTENIAIDYNTITINCLRDITRVGGILKLELVIIKNNKQKTTFSIDVNVVSSVISSNAEASKNVVSVIEILDNKIAQGKAIVKEVDDTKNNAIDTVNKLKKDTIDTLTTIKDDTIKQLNTTTEEVKTLKKETIEESTKIKDDAIKALEQIKTDSIKELNSIKDTANVDLAKVKEDTIAAVNKIAQEAIESINRYNIQDVSRKIDEHIKDNNMHVTKDIKDSIDKNTKDIDNVKQELKDNTITSLKTDVLSTKLDECAGGFVNIEEINGRTLVNLSKFTSITYNATIKSFESINTLDQLTKNRTLSIINSTGRRINVSSGARNFPCATQITTIALNADEYIKTVWGIESDGWTDANKNDLLKIMILDGEVKTPPTSYFEGIKSVGEPVLTDNIYNPRNPIMDGFRINETDGGLYKDSIGDGHTDYLAIKSNTQYQFSSTSDTVIPYAFYDSNKNFIRGGAERLSFTTPSNASYIRFSLKNSNLNSIQLNLIQYRIEILTKGENICPPIKTINDVIFNYNNCAAINYSKGLTTITAPANNYSFVIGKQMKVKANTQYTLFIDGYGDLNAYRLVSISNTNNGDRGSIEALTLSTTRTLHKRIFNTGNNTEIYLLLYPNANSSFNVNMYIYNYWIIEGTNLDIPYSEYKEDKTEIVMQQPLTQYDYIDENGKLNLSSYVEVFNGSESTWSIYSTSTRHTFISAFKNSSYSKTAICDKYPPITNPSNFDKVNGFYAFALGGFIISDTSCSTIDELKNKLKLNPITVVYQQCDNKYNPIYRSINLNKTLYLRAYDNLVVNSGAIQPTVSYSYAKNTGERITSIEDTVENVKDKVDNINYNVEYNLTPLNGMQTYSNTPSKVIKQGNICTVMISLDATNMQDFTKYGLAYLMLPEDCKPQNYIGDFYISTSTGISTVVLTKEGKISRGNIIPATKPTWVCGIFNYVI